MMGRLNVSKVVRVYFAVQVLIAGCLSLMGCRVRKLAWEADIRRSLSF